MEQGWDFHAMEERDGLRFTWHEWPASKLDATRIVIPIGCTCVPLRDYRRTVNYDSLAADGGDGATLISQKGRSAALLYTLLAVQVHTPSPD